MVQKTIMFNIPDSQLAQSMAYCRKRQEESDSGKVVPELGTLNSWHEGWIVVPCRNRTHNIAVLAELCDNPV